MEFDYHSWSVLLLVRTTTEFLVLIQVSMFFPNLEECVIWHLLMATSSHIKITSLYSIWIQPLEMSGFLFVQKLFVSLLWTMPCSWTSSDTGKYLREVGKKENYLTGVLGGNVIVLVSATLVSSCLQLLVYLFNKDHGHLSIWMWRRGKDVLIICLVPPLSFVFFYCETKRLQTLRCLDPMPLTHPFLLP